MKVLPSDAIIWIYLAADLYRSHAAGPGVSCFRAYLPGRRRSKASTGPAPINSDGARMSGSSTRRTSGPASTFTSLVRPRPPARNLTAGAGTPVIFRRGTCAGVSRLPPPVCQTST